MEKKREVFFFLPLEEEFRMEMVKSWKRRRMGGGTRVGGWLRASKSGMGIIEVRD